MSSVRPKVVISRSLGPDVMPLLLNRDDLQVVLWPEDRSCERAWLLENAHGAAGILVVPGSDKVDDELLEAAGPSLRVVSTVSVGYEHCDTNALARRNVKLGYTPDVLTDAVADISVMLALMAGRNAKETMNVVEDNQWPDYPWSPFAFCGPQLGVSPSCPTRVVGFLGFGRIAQATLERVIPFKVTHCIYTSNPSSTTDHARDAALAKKHSIKSLKRVDINELAEQSDILFVLAPGGAATRHLVNEDFLRKMKKKSILINTSRGTLVDSDALAKALQQGWIWGAGLDVVEREPNVTIDHPLVKEPRCVILPHIGSASIETGIEMGTLAVKNLLAGISGQTLPASVNLVGN